MGDAGWRGALYILRCPLLKYKGLWSYVDLEKRTIFILGGKGDQDRVVPPASVHTLAKVFDGPLAGLTDGQVYFVKLASDDPNAIQLTSTLDGAVVSLNSPALPGSGALDTLTQTNYGAAYVFERSGPNGAWVIPSIGLSCVAPTRSRSSRLPPS